MIVTMMLSASTPITWCFGVRIVEAFSLLQLCLPCGFSSVSFLCSPFLVMLFCFVACSTPIGQSRSLVVASFCLFVVVFRQVVSCSFFLNALYFIHYFKKKWGLSVSSSRGNFNRWTIIKLLIIKRTISHNSYTRK